MSQMGQKRRFDRASIISGLPRKADIFSVRRHVSKVPQPDSCSAAIRSAIRSSRRRGRPVIVDCQVERLRSLKIENEQMSCRELHRKVRTIDTSNDLIDIFRRVPEKIVKIGSIRH